MPRTTSIDCGPASLRVRRVIGIMLAMTLGLPLAFSGSPAPLQADEMIRFFGFDSDAIERMEQGEILSIDKADLEGSDKGLAIGLAMIIPHGVGDCTERFAGPEMFRLDPALLDVGRIEIEDIQGALAAVEFSPEEGSEAKQWLNARPGSEFNLSMADLDRIATASSAAEGLQTVLMVRFTTYHREGLPGIEPYQRSSTATASPAKDLEVALANSPMLEQRLPEFYAYLQRYPHSKPDGVEDRYYWAKRTVQGRPSLSLVHWTLLVEPEFAFLSEREFYAGHTYNATQAYFGVLPFKDGVMVFYLHRTFTDKVSGWGSGLKHRIGRGRVRNAVVKTFERLRAETK
jgi:hypothetical protein